jgi:hypothetical protein
MRRFAMAFVVLLASSGLAPAQETCEMTTRQACGCAVAELRPLQGAIGRTQVKERKAHIAAHLEREWQELQDDPIRVIRGPDGALFIADHHHGALAWLELGKQTLPCALVEGETVSFSSADEFWTKLQDAKLVRLKDERGRPIGPQQLPKTLASMPDDPYRSLASKVRRANGYCRENMTRTEFAEFVWADWLRDRVTVKPDDDIPEDVVRDAVALAQSKDAENVDGFSGGKACRKK